MWRLLGSVPQAVSTLPWPHLPEETVQTPIAIVRNSKVEREKSTIEVKVDWIECLPKVACQFHEQIGASSKNMVLKKMARLAFPSSLQTNCGESPALHKLNLEQNISKAEL